MDLIDVFLNPLEEESLVIKARVGLSNSLHVVASEPAECSHSIVTRDED